MSYEKMVLSNSEFLQNIMQSHCSESNYHVSSCTQTMLLTQAIVQLWTGGEWTIWDLSELGLS